MTDRKDWKAIADNCLKDIHVSEELKRKTLERCIRRNRFPTGRLLAAAACLVIFLGISQQYWKAPFQPDASEQGGSRERNIAAATDGKAEAPGAGIFAATAEGTDAGMQGAGTDSAGERTLATIAEARTAFGAGFLEPTRIPEGYAIGEIFASGEESNSAGKVTISFFKQDLSFFITEEKSDEPKEGFSGYKEVNINGTTGYMGNGKKKDSEDGTEKDAGIRQGGDIELYWYKAGVQYAITGALKEKEVLEMALSMK